MQFPTPQGVSSATFTPPPLDGSLSLPEIYDFHALHSPNHPLFVYHDGISLQTVNWGQAVRAVHRAARLVEASVSQYELPNKKLSTVVAVLANTDWFTYFILLAGIMRAGYQAFPISSRNSAMGIAHLIQKTRTKYLFVSADSAVQRLALGACEHPSIGGSVGSNLHILDMPAFETLLGPSSASMGIPQEEFAPLPPMIPPDCSDPAFILHSSGSTGLPRPVTMTHKALLQWGLLPYYGETDLCGEVLSSHCTPLTHALGSVQLAWTMTSGVILAGFAPNSCPTIPAPDDVFCSILETKCTVILGVPSFIEAWTLHQEYIAALRQFRAVVFAGAPMQKDIGDMLVREGVRLIPFFGVSEAGCLSTFLPKNILQDSWDYFTPSPHCKIQLVPRYDDVYQVVVIETPTAGLNIVNAKVNGIRAYCTNDLVTRHPTNPELLRVFGRVDDQIALSNGLKTNPLPQEQIISRHPLVKSCLLFGRGRLYVGALIEPAIQFDAQNPGLLMKFKDAIWEAIEEANRAACTHSRIFKEVILVSSPDKPLEYTPKGTLNRAAILAAYNEEINRLYGTVDTVSHSMPLAVPRAWTSNECLRFTRTAVEKILIHPLGDDDDIFQSGCDSIQSTWLRNTILNALSHHGPKVSLRNIPQNFVYSNPTIRKLAGYVEQIMNRGHASVGSSMSMLSGQMSMLSGKTSEMQGMVAKYASEFPEHRPRVQQKPQGDVVLLTGSTGGLGSHLLENLIKDPAVSRVYALNRPNVRSVYVRQSSSFKDRDLDYTILNSEKLQLLEGDLTLEGLGLYDDELYREIEASVTCIIHTAWSINFNVSLSTMEPLIAGTRRLIDMALRSPQATPPHFVFTSSLLVFNNSTEGTVAPESFNSRPITAIGNGYTESKWVAESVLAHAAESTALSPSIIRLGQLCGARNGSWNPREWFPTLIRSAQILRCLPQPDGYLSWMPVHAVAAAIMEMRHSRELFLNLSHPEPIAASCVLEPLSEILKVPLVRYSEWLVALEASRHGALLQNRPDAIGNPALVLLDFYRSAIGRSNGEVFGPAGVVTLRAMEAAPVLHTLLRQISRTDVENWLRYWCKIGFLTP
ncbi:hypothetical protein C8J56DRAFT_395210 [Mycena floridula]|nr:hypothetical protein C8J56DRAFT_395210 [Mycena floridula]